MTRFRPCIDLHDGKVKQIVGSTLKDEGAGPKVNFVSDRSPAWFAELYRRDGLTGGHVILLGKGNEQAAREALAAWPGGMQVGGGIRPCNGQEHLAAGASHVIVTSYLFETDGTFSETRLEKMTRAAGKERLVIDLSCKATPEGWTVAMNRWQTLTDLSITPATLIHLAGHCAEFLIHAVDVEGKCEGMDEDLVRFLAEHSPIPATYAGGIRHLDDLRRLDELSSSRLDGTIGSALDLFGGTGARYEDCVAFNHRSVQ